MLGLLKKDLDSYCKGGGLLVRLRTVVVEHTFHLVFFIRIGQCMRKVPIFGKVLGFVVEYFIRIVYSSDISCKARIGGGLFIVHGHDIVIGASVVIGDNCKIFNGVTLGGKNTETKAAPQPTISNDVVISTGAKVLGGIIVGNNCIIGANSVLISSVDDDWIVAGVPAKPIKRNL